MSTPEALGYAVCLDARGYYAEAAELRRQHAEIERLTALAGPSGKRLGELERINDDLIADNERLTAERDALRKQITHLQQRPTSLEVSEMRAALAAAPAPAPEPFGWPKLDKPAKVGGGTFNVGVSARLVVEAAQRQHEYAEAEGRKTPEEWRQVERARRELWDMLNGVPAPHPDTADAERYRWLRDKGCNTWVPFTWQWKMDAERCDAAIDAARAQAQGATP